MWCVKGRKCRSGMAHLPFILHYSTEYIAWASSFTYIFNLTKCGQIKYIDVNCKLGTCCRMLPLGYTYVGVSVYCLRMAWLCNVHIKSCTAICIMSHCRHAALPYSFAKVILLFHCHAALLPSYCVFSVSYCFASVMLLCLCDAALPLHCYFASVVLLCLWHAALLL